MQPGTSCTHQQQCVCMTFPNFASRGHYIFKMHISLVLAYPYLNGYNQKSATFFISNFGQPVEKCPRQFIEKSQHMTHQHSISTSYRSFDISVTQWQISKKKNSPICTKLAKYATRKVLHPPVVMCMHDIPKFCFQRPLHCQNAYIVSVNIPLPKHIFSKKFIAF